jgi:L,D-transpeptidase catalytic domain
MIKRLLLATSLGLLLIGCGPQGLSVPSIFNPLKPQTYTWYPERSTSGPVLVFVSIPRQEATVYRNGIRIGRAAVSTGRPGHSTPTGVFQILQKDVDHHSATYNNASMPYMERLTWDGVALHAGFNPGHPDSHGCVRLPGEFAKKLYGVTHTGGTVIISNNNKLPTMTLTESLSGGGGSIGKSGPTAIVVSLPGQKMQIYQNGRKVGESSVEPSGGLRGFKGESVFLYAKDNQWHTVEGNASFSNMKDDLRVSDAFREKIRAAVHPGTTMIITSEPVSPRGGQSRDVMSTN